MSMYDREWYREKYNKADNQNTNKSHPNAFDPYQYYGEYATYQHTGTEPSAAKGLRNRIIPTLCPLCGYYFHIQVKGGFGNTLKYKCPQCGKKVWIRVEHITDKIVKIILGSLGLCSLAYILFISWPALSDYLRMVLQQYLP